MDHIDALELGWKQGADVIAGVRPDDLSRPTPCGAWDVRGLLNHTLGEVVMMTEVNRGRAGGTDDHGDLVGDGRLLGVLWADTAEANVASWREGGVEGDRTYFYGTFPARAAVLINLGEVLVHTWDLAQSTGQHDIVDPELAAFVYGLYTAVPLEQMRENGVLGAEVAVPADAPVTDRLLGLLGRRP